METRRCVVHGRVQGVGYRFYVIRHARELDVRGTVRNRPDGAVEAVLQADSPSAIETLIGRIRRGPRASRVERIDVEALDDADRYDGFEVIW